MKCDRPAQTFYGVSPESEALHSSTMQYLMKCLSTIHHTHWTLHPRWVLPRMHDATTFQIGMLNLSTLYQSSSLSKMQIKRTFIQQQRSHWSNQEELHPADLQQQANISLSWTSLDSNQVNKIISKKTPRCEEKNLGISMDIRCSRSQEVYATQANLSRRAYCKDSLKKARWYNGHVRRAYLWAIE